jgi:hypothetical protein
MRFTRFAEALHNANAARRLGLAIQVRKERRMPMRLDDRALQDLGLDKGHAYLRLRLNHQLVRIVETHHSTQDSCTWRD